MRMNQLQLENYLRNMMQEAFRNGTIKENQNNHPCFYMAIINCIIKMYVNKVEYREENAIATFKGFLESGVLVW